MVRNLLIVCLLSTIAGHIKAQTPRQACITPDNQVGICVRIRSCPSLVAVLSQRVVFKTDRDFVRQSRCGIRGDLVCCTDSVTTQSEAIPSSTTTTRRPNTTIPRTVETNPSTTTTTRRLFTSTARTEVREPSKRISANKCNDYVRDYAELEKLKNSLNGTSSFDEESATQSFNSRVNTYLGEESGRGEFPHMALIGFYYENIVHWECGGTLISERFVLSAAHCYWTKKTGPAKYVRLGEHNIAETTDANHIDFFIIEIILNNNAPQQTFNDIVLFKLDRDVQLNHAIRPACLPQQKDVPRDVIATGWGTVRKGRRSNTLLKVNLTTFSQDEWNRTYIGQLYTKDYHYDEESMVFAGHHMLGKDSCDGDSGGPLQFLDNYYRSYIVVGVTSTGMSCGHIGTPAVYTHVYSHLDWIEQTVWPNQ